MKTTKAQFIEYFQDVLGESKETALEQAIEYRNDLVSYLEDCGWDSKDVAMLELKAWLA